MAQEDLTAAVGSFVDCYCLCSGVTEQYDRMHFSVIFNVGTSIRSILNAQGVTFLQHPQIKMQALPFLSGVI